MATREQLIEDFADHKYATGEKFERLINSMKVVQEPVTDPAASGTSLSFIDSISQDADGKITATKKTLDLANAHELNPFKGWYKTGDTLPTDGFDGAYLYFKDTSELTGQTTIYRWNGTAYADTGTVVDTSNVQTFETGQAVNDTGIKDLNGNNDQTAAGVLSAEAGKELNEKLYGAYDDSLESDALTLRNVINPATNNRAVVVFRNSTEPVWRVDAGRSGYVDLSGILQAGYKKLAVTMNKGSDVSGGITFVKKHLPTDTALTYQQLVDGDYICTEGKDAHPDAAHVRRSCTADSTRLFEIPEGAVYAYFMYFYPSDPESDTYLRRPSEVKGSSLFVNGDVQNLQDKTAENKDSLRKKVMPANLQGGYINAADGSINVMDGANAEIGTFVGIDAAKTYYASGRKHNSSSYVAIGYYDDEDTLLSTDDTMNDGVFTNHQLTLPTGTVKIKVQGNKNEQPAVLYVGEGVVDAGVAADTTEKLKENSLALLAPARVYGKTALRANGTLPSTTSEYAQVNEYDVNAGKVYLLSGYVVSANTYAMGVWLDANGNVVGGPIHQGNGTAAQMAVDESVVAPYGAAKLLVSGRNEDDGLHQRAYLKTFVANVIKDNYWYGKKCVWTGDSISWGSGLGDHRDAWPHKVCQALGMELKNYAIGGSILAKGITSNMEEVDPTAQNYDDVFLSMEDFNAATKDTSKQYLVKDDLYEIRPWGIYHYSGGSWVKYNTTSPHTAYSSSVDCGRTPVVDRIEEMDTDADLVVVAIGTNDFYYMWSDFGTMSSRDKTTFYGALHLVCQYLVETYHNKQIVFSNCIKRYQKTGQTRGTWDLEYPLTASPAGHTLEDYNAAMKEVCAYYSIPVVDMYTLSGLNPAFDPSMFADTNGMHTHPNEMGHIRMAEVMKAFLLGLKRGVDIVG